MPSVIPAGAPSLGCTNAELPLTLSPVFEADVRDRDAVPLSVVGDHLIPGSEVDSGSAVESPVIALLHDMHSSVFFQPVWMVFHSQFLPLLP